MRRCWIVMGLSPLVVFLLDVTTCEAQTRPTRMVVVEGKAMRIWSAGMESRKPGQPVVVLESGAGAGLDHFKPIFSQVAEHAPVFAYDRRGVGQSELDTVPQTLDRAAQSLHALLREARVPPPYVLVGASYGGIVIRKFGTLFPSEVGGFVYLDATDTPTRAELAHLPPGAVDAIFNLPPIPGDMPPGLRAEIESIAIGLRTEFSEARALRTPENVPVAAIIAGAKTWPGISQSARSGLVNLQITHQSQWTQTSPRGLLIVASKARHFLFNDEPELVVDAINYVVRNAIVNAAGASASATQQQTANSPFIGSWSADLSRSRLDSKVPLKGADITISVTGNIITLASVVVLPSGKTIQERETFRADGTETAATDTTGAFHVANWVGSHVLALITRKGNQNIALITYEVSADGQTLTARTAGSVDQMVIFNRRAP